MFGFFPLHHSPFNRTKACSVVRPNMLHVSKGCPTGCTVIMVMAAEQQTLP